MTTGSLSHDADYGYIGCATRWFDKTIISFDTIDAAVYMRFDVPDAAAWSFGFVYHANAENQDFNATYLYQTAAGRAGALHGTVADGDWIDHQDVTFRRGLLRSGTGGQNVLVFRTTEHGAFVRVNDLVVLNIPASELARQVGFAEICVGFHNAEDEDYTLNYGDLRDDWEHKNSGGSVFHSGAVAEFVGCNQLVLSQRTQHAWAVFDFEVPDVDNWSIGIFYHENLRRGAVTSTAIGVHGREAFYNHRHSLRGEWQDDPIRGDIDPSLFRRGRNAKNLVELTASPGGFWLRLNGEKVIDIPADELQPYPGRIEICTGHFVAEQERYAIRYSNLYAWAE